jgi:hypothetical protein
VADRKTFARSEPYWVCPDSDIGSARARQPQPPRFGTFQVCPKDWLTPPTGRLLMRQTAYARRLQAGMIGDGGGLLGGSPPCPA